MPLLTNVGRHTWSQRTFVAFIYATLTVFGATMAVPFLIMLTSSVSNSYDYERYSITPRALWSSDDRFMKGMPYFAGPGELLPDPPPQWTSWRSVGLDQSQAERIAGRYLEASPEQLSQWQRQAADYSDFALTHPLDDSVVTISREMSAEFIVDLYLKRAIEKTPGLADADRNTRHAAALALLSESWGVPLENYISIRFERENKAPVTQQSWVPPSGPKWDDYQTLVHAVRHGAQTPGVLSAWEDYLVARGYARDVAAGYSPLPMQAPAELSALWREFARTNAPLSPVIPLSLHDTWIDYLQSDAVRELLSIDDSMRFDVAFYNRLAGSRYATLHETPFPLPATDAFAGLRPAWELFLQRQFPLRLAHVDETPDVRARFEEFLRNSYERIENLNHLLGTAYADWSAVPLPASLPPGRADQGSGLREVWFAFVKGLPVRGRHFVSADAAWQAYLKDKYESLDALNEHYGWKLSLWEEARLPLDAAYVVTYRNNWLPISLEPVRFNYRTIVQFLVNQGNSVPVTIWLIVLSIGCSLTVNPLAGYALSRFNLKAKDKILLFCLATSAFPAMVSAIPGYLLMRDLGLLNTFFALVLPGAASGMSIFILKGFFDSLPQELYEAATIDGAREWQTFLFVTIPMVTPILAINALQAFIAAYDGWAWALIICQDKSMWTLSVWLYQANSWWAATPWITTAGFVVTSIPTLLVFVFCQKIIMRGIIVPSMK